MDSVDFDRVQRLDAPTVVSAMAAAGGPTVELIQELAGGEVGAWLVRWPNGHHGVLTWSPPVPPGQPAGFIDQALALVDIARGAGLPIPRYEAVVPLGDLGMAVLQERARGHTPQVATVTLVEHLLELAEVRRGLLVGTAFAGRPMALYLTSSGPGFCLHEPLRTFDHRTSALLEAIESIVGVDNDQLVGNDVVHFDYHLGNVMVDSARPDVVSAIIDWDGARPGSVALDLAILAFDLTWRAPGPVQQRVEDHLLATTEPAVLAKVWAHASLRLLDWNIRHHPQDIDHWIGVAAHHME